MHNDNIDTQYLERDKYGNDFSSLKSHTHTFHTDSSRSYPTSG